MPLKVVDLVHRQYDHGTQRTLAHDVQLEVLGNALRVRLLLLFGRLFFFLRHLRLGRRFILDRFLILRLCRYIRFLFFLLCRRLFLRLLFLGLLFGGCGHRFLFLCLGRFCVRCRSRGRLLCLFLLRLGGGFRFFRLSRRSRFYRSLGVLGLGWCRRLCRSLGILGLGWYGRLRRRLFLCGLYRRRRAVRLRRSFGFLRFGRDHRLDRLGRLLCRGDGFVSFGRFGGFCRPCIGRCFRGLLRGRTAERADQRIFLFFCHILLPPIRRNMSKPVST